MNENLRRHVVLPLWGLAEWAYRMLGLIFLLDLPISYLIPRVMYWDRSGCVSSMFLSYALGVLAVSPSLSNIYSWALLTPTISAHTVENSNTRLLLISCSQGILSSSSFSCCLLLRLLVYMYLSQLMRTFTNYLKCIVISS